MPSEIFILYMGHERGISSWFVYFCYLLMIKAFNVLKVLYIDHKNKSYVPYVFPLDHLNKEV